MTINYIHNVHVSDNRLFHLDILTTKYWFTMGAVGLTSGGYYTREDMIALRDLLNTVLGE